MKTRNKQKSKYQYLAGNIALFSVSNFVSKILVFLLVPLYTNVLTTSEYGVADLMQVTLLLLVPAITLNMGEAALRFGIEKAEERGSILRTGLKFTLGADLLVAFVCIIAAVIFASPVRTYLLLFILLFAANSLFEFLILFFQGSELVPIVVIGSVSSTLIMIISNIIFLLVIKIGLTGYIMSQVIAFALASTIMLILGKMAVENFESENSESGNSGSANYELRKNKDIEKEMLTFGIPMIAYSTGSWINNASDRYIVAGICGSSVNGIYGVAYKIPAILMVFQRIFAQAWQMSATKSYTEEKSEEFFTTMYKAYNTFMVIGCSFLILLVRPIASFLFKKEFYEAWSFVPPLLISVIFGALTGFLGSICLAHKDSKAMGLATSIGAAVNIILNLITVPVYGAMGAAWATAVSYCIMCFMAYVFVRKYVKLGNNLIIELIGYVLITIEALIMIFDIGNVYLNCLMVCLLLIVLFFREIKTIVISLLGVLKKRNEKSKG